MVKSGSASMVDHFVELDGCQTQADTEQELRTNAAEALPAPLPPMRPVTDSLRRYLDSVVVLRAVNHLDHCWLPDAQRLDALYVGTGRLLRIP